MKIDTIKKIVGGSVGVLGASFVGAVLLAKKHKPDSVYENDLEQKNPLEGKKVVFIEDENDPENADGVRGHLESVGEASMPSDIYNKYIKRGIDMVLSFGGLVVLSPIMGAIALAIKIEDPGPVLFTQKRLGQNKQYFKLHKFRSMKVSTPKDVPTHMLENPDQYITKVGKFIRAHSLDELPQIWDIFIGNMSVIGPRPGLWNQDVLTAERDKYGANNIKPGLTGWAQINGRDELELREKARLDGEYTENLGLKMDVKCFLKSLHVFGKDDSVIEGGTGELKKESFRNYTNDRTDDEIRGFIGFGEKIQVDYETPKKVLITGEHSYIGESFKTYAEINYPVLQVDTVDMIGDSWRKKDFSQYDIIYHVAGIAHADVGNVSNAVKEEYYRVNTDLTIDVCEKAKSEGVKEFIFMSSMIVYGDSAPYGKHKIVDSKTVPSASNFYGDSKLQADVGVRSLASDTFKVVVVRPPMIYGENSKGNYRTLSNLAKKLPVFPDINNQRSMLYIDNLCEFLCQVMLIKSMDRNAVVLIPQNAEWTKTSDMVKEIAITDGKDIRLLKIMKPIVWFGGKVPGKIGELVNKAFGNSCYDHSISEYEGLNYQKVDIKSSIKKTENTNIAKKVLFLVNHDVVIYNFRLELVERLLAEGYEVHISSPYGERIDELKALGAIFHEINLERHGMNPINETKLILTYTKLMSDVKPDIVLGYTIKPNIYGAIAAGKKNIPFIANITGLGTAVEKDGIKQKLFILLYRIAFRKVQRVFFQNEENRKLFVDNNIAIEKHGLLPGSGVNLNRFTVSQYPGDETIKFLFISRIMKEKGIDQYLDAAKEIKKKYKNVEFHICGFCESEYEGALDEASDNGVVIYHGMIRNVAEFMSKMHCIIHPTYYPEGLSNVLLESCASGRPIITTDRSGCREVVRDSVNGFMIPQKDTDALIKAIERFILLSFDDKKVMGINARKHVEENFSREIVVNAYMDEIYRL